MQSNVSQIDDPIKLADTIAGHLNISLDEKQALLEIIEVVFFLEAILGHMGEVGVLQVEENSWPCEAANGENQRGII